MSDVYRIQAVIDLGGTLAPELAKILKNMSAVEKAAKGVEKSIGRWSSPIDRASASMGRVVREMGNVERSAHRVEREVARAGKAMSGLKAPAAGLDRDMQKWATAIAPALAEMRSMRSSTQAVSSAARGVTRSIDSWSGKINSAAAAMHRMSSAAAGVHMPNVPRNGGGRFPVHPGGAAGAAAAAAVGGHGGRRGRRGGHGGHGTHGPLQHEGSALMGLIGVGGGLHTLSEVVETGVDMRHIELGMRQTGATQAQVDHARHTAQEGSKNFPNLSTLEIFEHINDLRGILGDIDKATHEAPDILPEFSALKAKAGNHGAKNAVREIYTAVKSAETANEITAEGVQKHVNSLTRLAFWYGDQLNPSKYFTAQKNAGQMLNLTSDRFRFGPFAALTQEIGEKAGTQFGTFAAKGVAGLRMTVAGLDDAYKYGLLQKETVSFSKKGRVQPGAQFSDVALDGKRYDRAKDSDLWLYKTIIPKLKAGGVNTDDQTELLRALGKIFSDKNAYGYLFTLARQRNKLEKDTAGFNNTSGDTTEYRKLDPYAATQGVKSQGGALATALSEPAIPGIVENLNRFSAALGGAAKTLEDHPVAAHTAFGVGTAAVGGLAATGGMRLAGMGLAAIVGGAAAAPISIAVGAGAAVTIATLIVPWDKLWSSMGFKPGLANGSKDDQGIRLTPGGSPDAMPGLGNLDRDERRLASTLGMGASKANTDAAVNRLGETAGPGAVQAAQAAAAAAGAAADDLIRSAQRVPPPMLDASRGFGAVTDAANGVPGALNAAAGSIASFVGRVVSGLNAAGAAGAPALPGAKGSGAGGGASGTAPAPGKQSSVIYRGGNGPPIQVASTIMMNERAVGRAVTRHQVAEANVPNGMQTFDNNTMITPVGYSAPFVG